MLLITSTSSPSTAAAELAYSWCSNRPPADRRSMIQASPPETNARVTAIAGLTTASRQTEKMIARHGGSRFQANTFSV